MLTNKRAGKCEKCGEWVPAGSGVVLKIAGDWRVYHTDHAPEETPPQLAFRIERGKAFFKWAGSRAPSEMFSLGRDILRKYEGRFDRSTEETSVEGHQAKSAIIALQDAGVPVRARSEADAEAMERLTTLKPWEMTEEELSARRAKLLARVERLQERLRKDGKSFRPYQIEGSLWLAMRDRSLLADDMGLGKTAQTMTSWPDEGQVLVISPSVAKGVWDRELRVWRPDLTPSVLKNKKSFRWPGVGEMAVASYGVMPDEPATLQDPLPGTTLVADEAHMLKDRKSIRTGRFRVLADKVRTNKGRVILLTATPILNEPFELYSLLQTLGVETEVFGSDHFNRFLYYFNGHKERFGYKFGQPRSDVADVLKKAVLRRVKKDVAGEIPSKTYSVLHVELTPEGQKAAGELGDILDEGSLEDVIEDIGEIQRKLAEKEREKIGREDGEDDGEDIDAFTTPERQENAIDESEAARLVSSKNLKGKELFRKMSQLREIIARAKMPEAEKLIEMYEAQNEPVLVFSAHRAPIDDLEKRPGWAVITGDTSPQKRAKIEDDFRAGKYRGIGLTIQAGGVAITLTRACNAIFVDRMFTPALNTQAEDRIHRIGQKRPVTITILIGDHKIERRVEEIITRKQELFERSINATSVREGGVLLPKPGDAPDTRKVLLSLVNESNVAIEKEAARIKERDEAAKRRRALAEQAAKAWASKALAALVEYEASLGPTGRPRKDIEAEVARTAAKMADALASSFVEEGAATPADTALKAWAIAGLRQLLENDYEPQKKNEIGFSSSTRSAGTLSVMLYNMQGGLTNEQWEVAIKAARHHTGQIGDAPEGASAFVVHTRPGLGALSTKAGLLARSMQIEQMARDLEAARHTGNKAAEKRAIFALAREEASLREIVLAAPEGEERENARAVVEPLLQMAKLARAGGRPAAPAAEPAVAAEPVAVVPAAPAPAAPAATAPLLATSDVEDRLYSMLEIEQMLADRGWDRICLRPYSDIVFGVEPELPVRQWQAPVYDKWRARVGYSCAVMRMVPGEGDKVVGSFKAEMATTNVDEKVFRLNGALLEALGDPSLALSPVPAESFVAYREALPLSVEEEQMLREAFAKGPITFPTVAQAPVLANAMMLGLVVRTDRGYEAKPGSSTLAPAAPAPAAPAPATPEPTITSVKKMPDEYGNTRWRVVVAGRQIDIYRDTTQFGYAVWYADTSHVVHPDSSEAKIDIDRLGQTKEEALQTLLSIAKGEYKVTPRWFLEAPVVQIAPGQPAPVPAAPAPEQPAASPAEETKVMPPRVKKQAPAKEAPEAPKTPAPLSIDAFAPPLTEAEVRDLRAALSRGPIPGIVPQDIVAAARKAIARGDLVWRGESGKDPGATGVWIAATDLLQTSEASAASAGTVPRTPKKADIGKGLAPRTQAQIDAFNEKFAAKLDAVLGEFTPVVGALGHHLFDSDMGPLYARPNTLVSSPGVNLFVASAQPEKLPPGESSKFGRLYDIEQEGDVEEAVAHLRGWLASVKARAPRNIGLFLSSLRPKDAPPAPVAPPPPAAPPPPVAPTPSRPRPVDPSKAKAVEIMNSRLALGRDLESLSKTGASQTGVTLEALIVVLGRLRASAEDLLSSSSGDEARRILTNEIEALKTYEVDARDLLARRPPVVAQEPAPASLDERLKEHLRSLIMYGNARAFFKPGTTTKITMELVGSDRWILHAEQGQSKSTLQTPVSLDQAIDLLVRAGATKALSPAMPAPTPTAPPAAAPAEIVFPLSALLPPRESYREDTDKGVLVYVGPGELGVDDKGKPRIFPYARWVEAPAEVGGHAVFIPKGKAGGADVRLVSPAGKLVVAFDGPKPDGSFEVFLHAGFRRADGGKIVKNTWQGHVRDPILAGYKLLEGTLGAARTIVVPVPAGYCLSLVRSGLALRDAAVLYDPVVTGLEGALSMTTPTREIAVGWNNRGVQADLYELRLQRDVRHRHAITSLTLASPAEIPEAVNLLSRK